MCRGDKSCSNTRVYSTQRVAIKFWSHVTLVKTFCHKLFESIAQRISLRRYFQSSDHSGRYRTPQPNILKSLLKQLRRFPNEREIQNSSSLLSDHHWHCLNLSRSASLLCLCVLFLMIKLFASLPSVSLMHKSLKVLPPPPPPPPAQLVLKLYFSLDQLLIC